MHAEHGVAHPLLLLEEAAPEREPLGSCVGPWPVTTLLQLVPVGLGVLPDAVVALSQLRVGDVEAELADLRHVAVEELLARLLVCPAT